MRKNYAYGNIYDKHISSVSGELCYRFSYEVKLLATTNATLMRNFLKVAEWIKTNCPTLNGEFKCKHAVYHWTKLVVENGKAYLETGSHGWGFDIALSTTETATFTRGSCQEFPHAFKKALFFRNDRLEEFLTQWPNIKAQVVAKNNVQRNVFSETFSA